MAEDSDILRQMRDYLERQIAWCVVSLDVVRSIDLSALSDGVAQNKLLDDTVIDALVTWQASIEKKIKEFQLEFKPLLHAWHTADHIREGERNAMRELADQAECSINELSAKCLVVAECIGSRSMQMHDGLSTLARGRGMLNRYRVYTDDDASFIDKKA